MFELVSSFSSVVTAQQAAGIPDKHLGSRPPPVGLITAALG
jgi:hypothetical protein